MRHIVRKTKITSLGIGLALILLLTTLFFNHVYAQNLDTTNQKIAKKTFAELVVDFIKPKPTTNKKCYKDLKKGAAENLNICALKKANVLPPAVKNNFYPDAETSWSFAIQTLCRAQKWTSKKTFKNCTAYARDHGILNAPIPKKLSSNAKITSGELNILLERTYDSLLAPPPPQLVPPGPVTEIPSFIPPLPTAPLTFTPVSEKTIPKNFFAKIALSNDLPNRFYLNEVYFIEGDIVNSSEEEALVFLCKEKKCDDDSLNFIGDVTANHFKIPVHFKEAGNFQIGIFPGRSGQSIIENISVLPENPPETYNGQTATNLNVNYSDGKTTFSWDGSGTYTRLIIFQGSKRRDYIFRQGIKSFTPESVDFKDFMQSQAGWAVKQDNQISAIQKIHLTVQEFKKIEKKQIQVTLLPEILSAPGQFKFAGKALDLISKKASITLPDGSVKTIPISEQDILAQTNFTVETSLDTAGIYIFEINDTKGGAVVNTPIYVEDSVLGKNIPLLPDYFALNPGKLDISPVQNLITARQTLLNLINADRNLHGLNPVTISEALNEIAQGHSQNMVKLNFFGHVNPAGDGPDDRRKKAKFPSAIRENLAKSSTFELAEAGLMRSPIHREVILDPTLSLVGLGIAKNSEGYLIVTQNFSETPLTTNNLPLIENYLLNAANESRNLNGFILLTNDEQLKNIASNWAKNMATKGFFSTTDPDGGTLLSIIRNQGINSSVQAHIVQTNSQDQLTEEIKKQSGLNNAQNNKIGIGLWLNEIGELSMVTIYTP